VSAERRRRFGAKRAVPDGIVDATLAVGEYARATRRTSVKAVKLSMKLETS
jgi:hypothetical protein